LCELLSFALHKKIRGEIVPPDTFLSRKNA